MSSIFDAIIYFPQYPEPDHRDFDTLEEAIEAKRNWENQIKQDMALCCPRCNYIQHAKYTTLTVNMKSDNDPYNPRDIVVNRLFQCYDCENNVFVSNTTPTEFFQKIEEVHAKPFQF